MKKKVLVPVAEGTEELEAIAVIDILRRGAIEVVVAGDFDVVHCSRGVKIVPDILLKDLSEAELFDAVVLPGGMQGVQNFIGNKQLAEILKNHSRNNRILCAICAAPILLAKHELVQHGNSITAHPSVAAEFSDYVYLSEKTVKAQNIITSRGAGTAIDFALEIVRELSGEATANKITRDIVYNY